MIDCVKGLTKKHPIKAFNYIQFHTRGDLCSRQAITIPHSKRLAPISFHLNQFSFKTSSHVSSNPCPYILHLFRFSIFSLTTNPAELLASSSSISPFNSNRLQSSNDFRYV